MINIGFVGFGGIAKVHLDNYLLMDNVRVNSAVVHSDLSKFKAKKVGLRTYETIEEMVSNEKLDVIDVLTPTHLHKRHVLESLSLNKHVIVEKPIALKKSDAYEMFEYAKKRNLKLCVGQVVRFSYESEVLKDIHANKKLGKVIDVYFERLSSLPQWSSNNWFLDIEKSGLIPFDLHIHDLDLMISLFGKPKSYEVQACGKENLSYKEQYRINYHYDGFDVLAVASWYDANYPFKANWRIIFEDGILEYFNQKLILYQMGKNPQEFRDDLIYSQTTSINLPSSSMFFKELSYFISCIANDREVMIKAEEVLNTIEILEDILNL